MSSILMWGAFLWGIGLVCMVILKLAGHKAGLNDSFVFAAILAVLIGIGILGYNAIYT